MIEYLRDEDLRVNSGWWCAYAICRISGLPVSRLDLLRADDACRLLDALIESGAAIGEARDVLTARLYDLIGESTDRRARNGLLKLRRRIYHLDLPAEENLVELDCLLPKPVREGIASLRRATEEAGRAEAAFERSYGEESVRLRRSLQALLRDADFRNGLLLSSRSLSDALPRYLAIGGRNLTGREEKLERGLLRYLTRMAAKATPFGTFCAVIPAGLSVPDSAADAEGYRFIGDPKLKRSFVRINKNLYGILLSHLKPRPAVRKHLSVELNPTVRVEGARLVFLAAVRGREVFQRVQRNEVLDLIAGLLREHPALALGRLVEAIASDPRVDAEVEEVERYLDRLLEIGLLRFRIGIREQEVDWDLPLHRLLEEIEDEHARQIALLLERLRGCMDRYAQAEADERAELLAEVNAECESAFEAVKVPARVRKGLVVYEDATADAVLPLPSDVNTRRLLGRLGELAEWTARLAWPRGEQATMRHFFDTYYGAEVESVPLLQFYEEYFREHFKDHLEKERKARAGGAKEELGGYDLLNPFGLDLIRGMQEGQRGLAALIRTRWAEDPEAEEISITAGDLAQVLGRVAPAADPCRSLTFFATPVRPGGRWPEGALVVPGGTHLAGYGKYFSRFLYMLPEPVRARLFADNEALTTHRLAEICGDAQFNANLHPPLLRWEVSYPTGESGEAEEQLQISDLSVTRHTSDPHALCIQHEPSGQRAIPVDLGFLNPRMRPPLYQLLSRFTPASNFGMGVPEGYEHPAKGAPAAGGEEGSQGHGEGGGGAPTSAAVDHREEPVAEAATAPSVRCRPRVAYEGAIVLARRSWFVASGAFPRPQVGERASEHFARVNRWRLEHGIPDEVYVRIRPLRPRPGHASPDTAAESEADPHGIEVGEAEAREADAEGTEAPEAGAPPRAEDARDDAQGERADADGAEAPTSELEAARVRRRRTAISRDFHKPQFIDFRNPLLVKLFGKMPTNVARFVAVIEERLPGATALPEYEGERYVSELILQLNVRESASTPDEARPVPVEETREVLV